MTLFFNIEVLEKETKGDTQYMLVALERWFKKDRIAKNAKERYKPLTKSLSGSSFLLNPDKFFKDKTTDSIYKLQYLKLAAKRDYTLYTLYGSKFLDLSFLPDINLSAIQTNPIISIQQNKIFFKYEEI